MRVKELWIEHQPDGTVDMIVKIVPEEGGWVYRLKNVQPLNWEPGPIAESDASEDVIEIVNMKFEPFQAPKSEIFSAKMDESFNKWFRRETMGTLADKASKIVTSAAEAVQDKEPNSAAEAVMRMVAAQTGVAVVLVEAIENLTSAVMIVAKQIAKVEDREPSCEENERLKKELAEWGERLTKFITCVKCGEQPRLTTCYKCTNHGDIT